MTRDVRNILSINFNHDGSAVLLSEGRIRGFVTTERFSRLKKHPGLRAVDLAELLDQAGLSLTEVDQVLLCNLHLMDSPDVVTLHGSDLKDTWFEFWVNQTGSVVSIDGHRIPCVVNPDHHLIHAAAAFFTSPFESAAALAIDPTGCRAFLGRGNRIFPLRRNYDDWFNANVGYCSVSENLFGSSIVGAGKVMGLAPYGRPVTAAEPPDDLVDFAQLMALAQRDPTYVAVGDHSLNATLAYYVQVGLERQVVAVLADLAGVCRRNGIPPSICLSGGTALNAIANQIGFAESDFEELHLHPACGDDGTAIGAALWYWHHVLGNPRTRYEAADLMYSVRTYDQRAIDRALDVRAGEIRVEATSDHVGRAADLLVEGAVLGWWDGASEVGPRALGHRSILADPRDPTMRERLNERVKFREHFRPFAPTILRERASQWFGMQDSPFMLRAAPVREPERVPAITHVDGTSRPQTLARRDNPAFYDLIRRFEGMTGIPMVLNTSLNTRGEPIVETPGNAVDTLLGSELDYLVLPHAVVSRR